MTTMIKRGTVNHEDTLYSALGLLCDEEFMGHRVLKAGDVQSMLSDICLEYRCHWRDLPKALEFMHDQATQQIKDSHYGGSGFNTRNLIKSVERALL